MNALRTSDDPEVVHQARIGWRRFSSALRLFKPALAPESVPSWEALQPLLSSLSELRDIDVARIDTLPQLADVYTAGDSRRRDAWQSAMQAVWQTGDLHRQTVRKVLQDPSVGCSLLKATQWLAELTPLGVPSKAKKKRNPGLQSWARRRVGHLRAQLKDASRDSGCGNSAHRVRIHAKRLRYAIAALHHFLPKRQAECWYQQAASLQQSLGADRDLVQASVCVARLDVDPALSEFLRGFAVGRA